MDFSLLSIGCWGPGFNNWSELSDIFINKNAKLTATLNPKPEVIPATERRRAPLPVKLAIESSWQAVQLSKLDVRTLPCIFASSYGDTEINDYMCRTLNTDTKLVSPTKFHNSVHNAAAGYWTISTNCTQAANSTAADEYSFSMSLLEGALQASSNQSPILLTFFDSPVCDVLHPLFNNEHAFSASIVIAPSESVDKNLKPLATISLSFNNNQNEWPRLSQAVLNDLYENCPTAKVLSLLEKVCSDNTASELHLPTSEDNSLTIKIS